MGNKYLWIVKRLCISRFVSLNLYVLRVQHFFRAKCPDIVKCFSRGNDLRDSFTLICIDTNFIHLVSLLLTRSKADNTSLY